MLIGSDAHKFGVKGGSQGWVHAFASYQIRDGI